MTPVADAIRAMQDRLGRPEWWCKGVLEDDLGAVCIRGAQFEVVESMSLSQEVGDLLNDLVEGWVSYPLVTVTNFNDDPKTTHADILLFLDTALDIAEAEGL